MEWHSMIQDFLDYLRYEKNRSVLTVKSYGEDLRAFEGYFENLKVIYSWAFNDTRFFGLLEIREKSFSTHC